MAFFNTDASARNFRQNNNRLRAASARNAQNAILSAGQRNQITAQFFDQTTADQETARQQANPPGIVKDSLLFTASVFLDFVDTVNSSVSNGIDTITGVQFAERGDLFRTGLTEGLRQYYETNQGKVEATSGVGGAIAIGALTSGVALPALGNQLARSTALQGSRLFQLGQGANAATRAGVIARSLEAASRGGMLNAWRSAEAWRFAGLRIGQTVGTIAAEEASILTLMHMNDLIWDPEDMASNAFWTVILPGVLGVSIGGLRARRELRGIANNPLVISVRAGAQDAVGVSRLVEEFVPQLAVDLSRSTLQNTKAPTASITRRALNAHQAAPTTNAGLASIVDATAAGERQALSLDLRKAGFTKEQTNWWGPEVLKNDPLTLHGLDAVFPNNGTGKVAQLEDELEEALGAASNLHAQGNIAEAAKFTLRAKELESQINRVAINVNGTWYSRQEGEELIRLADMPKAEITRSPEAGKDIVNVRLSNGQVAEVSFSGLTIPKGKFATLPLRDKLAIADGFKRMSAELRKLGRPLQVSSAPDVHWLELDTAIWHASKGGDVKLPKGINSLDELEAISLQKKAKEILDGQAPFQQALDFVAMNLPMPSYAERISGDLSDTTRAILEGARNGMNTEELRALRRSMQDIAGFAKATDQAPALSGDLFDIIDSIADAAKRPIYGILEEAGVAQKDRILAAVTDRLIEDRLATISTLIVTKEGDQPGFVASLASQLLNDPDFVKASRVHGLADDQVTGLGNALNQLAGETRTAELRARDSETMLALIRTVEQIARQTDNFTRDLLARHLGDATEKLSGPGGRFSRTLLNAFHTYGRGWDIEVAVPLANSAPSGREVRAVNGLQLAITKGNADRLNVTIKDMRDAEEAGNPFLLLNPRTKKPIALDDVALDWQLRFNNMTDELLSETNRIRTSMNIRPLARRAWYIPPTPTEGKFVGFVFDSNNELVPNRTIIADTQVSFDRQRRLLETELGGSFRIRTREQASAYLDAFDEAEMDWAAAGSLTAPIRAQAGGLGTEFIQQNSIQDALGWAQNRAEGLGRGTIRALLDEQIRSARIRHNVEVIMRGGDQSRRTIFQEYEAIARGIPLSNLESSISGNFVSSLTRQGQRLIDSVWPTLEHFTPRAATRFANDAVQRMGVPDTKAERIFGKGATYESIARELGEFSPYRSFADFIEQNHNISQPPQIRRLSQQLNTLSAALILRYADIHQAGMNLIGLITTLPAIVRAGSAPVTTFGRGNKISVLDTVKILSDAVVDMVSPRSAQDWEFMVRNGDTTQQVLDFNQTMALVKDRNSFTRVFLGSGDKTRASKAKTRVGRIFQERGIDGLISIATDSTENFSRSYSHMVGLRVARMTGHTSMEAAHKFAREIANAGIANYSIVNRPEVYQSAFGSLFGLFTSWSRTYNQRLFRWLEDGEFARLGEQFAIQTALFGVTGNVGFNQLSWLFDKTVGGRDAENKGQEVPTIVDRIYARLGPEAGAAVSYGGIANFTGLALWTRGDVNLRQPTLDPFQNAPALGLLQQVSRVVKDTFVADGDLELISESLSRNLPNRVARGLWTELVEGGTEVDATGRIVAESQSFVDSIARMSGIRSARQQVQIEAYYANSAAVRNDAVRMTPVRLKTRSLIRKGQFTSERAIQVFDDYVSVGGNPINFNSWLQSQVREVASPRDLRQVMRALNNPQLQLRVWRHDALTRGF